MDKAYEAVRDLVFEVFPNIPQILNENDFLSKKFNPPYVFIETQKVNEKGYSMNTRMVTADAGLKFFFPKKTTNGTVEYQKYDVSNLSEFFHNSRYVYTSSTADIAIMIRQKDISVDQSQPDSVEFFFRFEYLDEYDNAPVGRIENIVVENV